MTLARRLVGFGPHAGAHRIAARAAISVLVPLLVLEATGHLSWSIYAAFGAFTSLYGRDRVDVDRLRLQVTAGATQTACVVLGAVVAVSEQRAWVAVPVAGAIAFAASYVSARERWHPPGALFQVFAFAAVASVPGHWSGVGTAAAVCGLSAIFAVLVGSVGLAVRRSRRLDLGGDPLPIGGAREGLVRYAVQAAIGVVLAGAIATGAGIGRPYWAMVSAVVPLVARDLTAQVTRGLHRIVGTAFGLALAWVLLSVHLSGLGTVCVIAALQAGAELLVGRNYALALLMVTPLALLMVHLVAPVPTGQLIADRGLETLIGAIVGMAVGWVGRPRESTTSRR